ncbi:hypothetical protein [Litoreibacter roseus]|nr:hypothetical protein [Litoreibacter roseus]
MEWEEDPNAERFTPYLSWWLLNEGKNRDRVDGLAVQRKVLPDDARDVQIEQRATVPDTVKRAPQKGASAPVRSGRATLAIMGNFGTDEQDREAIPVPDFADNPDFDSTTGWADADGIDDAPPKDSVIVGIIDEAIALGHERFMQKDGKKTRILSSWQQTAPFNGQVHLPFGEELQQTALNSLLAQHRTPDGWLDETAFYREAHVSNYDDALGQRDIDLRVSHGTHVLDLAAGEDIHRTDINADDLAKQPIIAVNLPARATIGSSGSFLEYFVVFAIQRIVDMADAIWEKAYGSTETVRGYPVVINLSYGLQAGPKDGTMIIEEYITRITKQRAEDAKAPVRIVLPAGNDNLKEGHAEETLTDDSPVLELPWRTLPEDQSSNYVEVWSDIIEDPSVLTPGLPLEIGLTAPDGRELPIGPGFPDSFLPFSDYCRIYCRLEGNTQQRPGGPVPVWRVRYVICGAPSLRYTGPAIAAPAGLWTIRVRKAAHWPGDQSAFCYVQSDQSPRPSSTTGLLSNFDHPHYERMEHDGSLRDTYAFPVGPGGPTDLEPAGAFGPVQRKGTLNAIATFEQAIVVAGHRKTDGRPAPYSSTGKPGANATNRTSPTASFPADDSPAHTGQMAAGARSSSAVIMQGTSFATAFGTRWVARDLATWHVQRNPMSTLGSQANMLAAAAAAEATPNRPYEGGVAPWKSGDGRFEALTDDRLKRVDYGS